jgi:hypothetical protein
LIRVHCISRGTYEGPPAGFDLDAACRDVEDRLVALVPDAVAHLAVDDPIACVALSYDRSDPLSVVGVHAATADERAALAAIDAEAAWSPAEFDAGTDVELDNARLLRQGLALLDADDHDAAAGSEAGRRLLCAVAARL